MKKGDNDYYDAGFLHGQEESAERIAKLEAALKPFADNADESTAKLADDYMYSDCFPMSAFRAAKAALVEKG